MGLRIAVVEDDLLVRDGIVRLLCTTPDLDVVASCGDFDEGVAAIESEDPDVGPTDIRMQEQFADRRGAFLTKRTEEKNVNSIFLKLGLGHADDVSERVKAALIFVAETHTSPVA